MSILTPERLDEIRKQHACYADMDCSVAVYDLLTHIAALTSPAEGEVGEAIVNLRRFEKAFKSDLGWGSKLLGHIANLLTRISADRDKWKFCVERLEERAESAERERDEAADALERAAQICDRANAGLVTPDGGSPTPRELFLNVAADIRALKVNK